MSSLYRLNQLCSDLKPNQIHIESKEPSLGFIKYIGNVDGSKNNYAGIEWLTPGRGSHNGAHKGVQYFLASNNNASFLKEGSFTAYPSLSELLLERYSYDDEKLARIQDEADKLTLINTLSKQELKIEFVGISHSALQKSNYQNRREISFAGELVGELGDFDVLDEYLSSIHHLDISNTYFQTSDVVTIIEKSPQLKFLNLSGIALEWRDASFQTPHMNCSELVISNTGFKLSHFTKIIEAFPALKRLHISNNDIWDSDIKLSPNIEFLDIAMTGATWAKVYSFIDGSNLKRLILSRNSEIGDDILELNLPNLTYIALDRTGITEWSTFEKLFKINQETSNLPKLSGLKNTDTPLANKYTPAVFNRLCISRLSPPLKDLNGHHLTNHEIDQVQLLYINQLLDDISNEVISIEESCNENCRFEYLIERFSLHDKLTDISDTKDERTTVNIYSKQREFLFTMHVPSNILVLDVFDYIFETLNVYPTDWSSPPSLLVEPLNEIFYYSNLAVTSMCLFSGSKIFLQF